MSQNVYLVFVGEYEDYRPTHIFADRALAQRLADWIDKQKPEYGWHGAEVVEMEILTQLPQSVKVGRTRVETPV
jgi:hypothetical protein